MTASRRTWVSLLWIGLACLPALAAEADSRPAASATPVAANTPGVPGPGAILQTGATLMPAGALDAAGAPGLQQGDVIDLGGRPAAIRTLDTLPFVQNAVSRKLIFDRYGDPELDKLRFQCRLDDVVATGRDEFQRQLLLMEWAYSQIEYGDPQAAGKGKVREATEVLRLAEEEKAGREVRVNGESVKGLEAAAIEPTGGWQMWRDVKLPAKVHLKKGDNVLRLTCFWGGLNLDEIRLAPAGN